MLTSLMHIRTLWSDYFTGSPTLIQSTEYGTRQTPSGNVHVLNCLFRTITSTSNGGALYCSTSVTCLLVESSSFFSCKTNSGYGGAIYFHNTNSGQSVLYKVCGYDCRGSNNKCSEGQFSRMIMYNAASSKCYFNYSSISRCMNEYSDGGYTLCNQNGKHCYPSVNLSMNKCYLPPGIYCDPLADSNSITGSISYSSFVDNIGTGYICIWFCRSGVKCEIKSCNILRNSHVSTSHGIIQASGNMIISDSCILENIGTYIFYASSSYTITLTNCTVDKITRSGSLIIQNTVTTSFILALNHMSTRNCHSEYDSAGTLTPISRSSSSSKKQKLYYSCDCLLNLHQQGSIASLASILVFNFINPYTSRNSFY
jgi:hypothetical protein